MQIRLLIPLLAFVFGCICEEAPRCKNYDVEAFWAIKGFDKKDCAGRLAGRDSGVWSTSCRKFPRPASSFNAVGRNKCRVDVWHTSKCTGEADFSTDDAESVDSGVLGIFGGEEFRRLKEGDITGAVMYYKATCS
jgi:hypothetical protein